MYILDDLSAEKLISTLLPFQIKTHGQIRDTGANSQMPQRAVLSAKFDSQAR